ncbi:uncharacterized protein SPPG_04650 [Spizellomyces punctatus DAOM BR117]|uniref:Uncharacterized protein n=1 Tax=Spizellomyces punctatus (strain DAOM BR117) TaxID=645134 RepID=A0A0L0HFR2_SPIPD|nr:uncharacterized protein SPPG_04650 [Spizellomyces punctatus DAOM BR117]KND00326.1 hypothetical protein SPPG_04650 [Spizellomyces punctatus DAOM BR117]|eukprot:XP_016608365.1 hypothetical protein SPPG_04650 [Spizellomyces punctatus DAOM BR117]
MTPSNSHVLTLCLLLLTLTSLLSTSATPFNTRYELDPSSLHTHTPRYHRTSARPHKRQHSPTPPSNKSIILDFQCNLPGQVSTWDNEKVGLPRESDNTCTKAHATFLRAIERLQRVIYFQIPIRLQARFASLCPSDSTIASCRAKMDVLGSAGPSAWHGWDPSAAQALGVDPDYLYPSALAKQYAPDEFDGQTPDISASFNSDPLWWFPTIEHPIGSPNDNEWNADQAWTKQWGNIQQYLPVKLKGKVFDFEQIVLHELIHGLGFISSWYTWIDGDSILPSSLDTAANGTVLGLTKPYLFNKWMADTANGVWMKEYEAQIIAAAYQIAQTLPDDAIWTQAFKASDAYKLPVRLFDTIATTPGAIAIYYPVRSYVDNVVLRYAVLHTPSEFSDGSTFSHVDSGAYSGTGSYLMRPFGTPSTGLDAMRPVGEPIDEVVLGILRAMGYATALTPL